jgi:hypothetical protein
MAGYGLQIAQGIKEGSIVGPNIYSSNKIIVSLLEYRGVACF